MSDDINPVIHDALNLDGTPQKLQAFYAKWAATYDTDLEHEYVAPKFTADLVAKLIGDAGLDPTAVRVMDAGCGTGLIGHLLQERGFTQIDGFDLSPEMVEKAAETGAYQSLFSDVNLNEPLTRFESGQYDLVTCIGVFTLGHVLPIAVQHLNGLCRDGGYIVLSTRTSYADEYHYEAMSDRLIAQGELELIEVLRDRPYTDDGNAHYWIYRSLKNAE